MLFGDADRLVVGSLQVLSISALLLAGMRFELGLYYYSALLVSAALFAYHQLLIKEREPERCFKAFKHNNWVGLIIFLGIAAHYHMATG
ncbi:MAG: 4-hydroxybenzoate polyprenyltransferase [Halioglobus sp.]